VFRTGPKWPEFTAFGARISVAKSKRLRGSPIGIVGFAENQVKSIDVGGIHEDLLALAFACFKLVGRWAA
jgi:hypothetical protein